MPIGGLNEADQRAGVEEGTRERALALGAGFGPVSISALPSFDALSTTMTSCSGSIQARHFLSLSRVL